jgi:TATA-box binding protein (TBP) (component of TFIID and TFIIIB)
MFKDISVSTQTVIIKTNINNIDITKLYENIKIDSDLIDIKYKNTESLQTIKKNLKNFINCVTITIVTPLPIRKKINVKVFYNGTFQMTGCKADYHITFCMNKIIYELKNNFCFDMKEHPIFYFINSVMKNINFNLNFNIDRKALGEFLSTNTVYSIPQATTGYMGVKIKIPVSNIESVNITRVSWPENIIDLIPFNDYFANDPKKLEKKYFVSISIFRNGKVLMSGMDSSVIEPNYNWFIEMMNANKSVFQIIDKPNKTFIHRHTVYKP